MRTAEKIERLVDMFFVKINQAILWIFAVVALSAMASMLVGAAYKMLFDTCMFCG